MKPPALPALLIALFVLSGTALAGSQHGLVTYRSASSEALLTQANEGDAEAQLEVGADYFDNNDMAQAAIWLEKSARQGNLSAMVILAEMNRDGFAVTQDFKSAYEQTLQINDPYGDPYGAYYVLATMYQQGNGAPRNAATAIELYTTVTGVSRSSELIAKAQAGLGSVYAAGEGLPRNMETAIRWYIPAAHGGNLEAQMALGAIYQNGTGVPSDFESAKEYYLMAANQSHAEGHFQLGQLYHARNDYDDNIEAYVRWNLAADLGYPVAMDEVTAVSSSFTPVELSEANQALALYRQDFGITD